MRLRTQFILTILLFGIITVVIAASAIITNHQIEKAMEQEKRAVDIAAGADELGYLSNDYLIYREDLQLKRWQKRFASFAEQVASLHVNRPEQQALVANIQANQNRLKNVLDSVASAPGNLSRNKNAALDPASLQVSWSRMAVQSQGLASDASRLSQLLHQHTDELIYKRAMLIYAMVGLFGLFLLVSYMQTYRRILKSIVTLRDITAVIGSGNLDFVIKETKNDEIGELSRAFNQMTTDLKAVTASKTDLEREITERKWTQEALRKSEEKYLKTFQSNPACVGLSRLSDGFVIEANEVMLKLLGYNEDEFIGHTMPELGVWNDLADRERMLQILMTEGRSTNKEYWLRTKKGELLLCNHSAEVIQIADVPHIIFTFFDITERRRVEEALRESEEHYRNLYENLRDAVAAVDKYGMIVECNNRFLNMLGYSFEELTHLAYSDITPKKWHATEESILKNQVDVLGYSDLYEKEYIRKDGTLFPIELQTYLVHDMQGNNVGYWAIVRDITERKRLEEELKKSEEESRLLIKYAPSMIYELDFSGPRFITVNDAMCSILGYTREELLSKNPLDLLEAESRKIFQDRIRKQLAGEKLSDLIEYAGRAKDGRIVYCLLNISFTYKDGKPLGAVVIAHDITERKKAEQALAERTAKLEEINKELESFSYSISHDLRAPLRAIDGYTRSILKKTGDKFDEETTRKFNDIRSNAQMMGKLIDDILTLSRLGRAKMSIVNLAIEGIINDVWKELQTINPGRNMTLTIQAMPSVYGDRTLIKQVYSNLLSNAVKFTKYKNPAQIETGGYTDGNDHVYYVKDNGVGFDMAYYDKLFGIFQRLHNNPDFEGTGVGLATIQRAIHMHGGRVWAEGKVNEGATFYFTLPI